MDLEAVERAFDTAWDLGLPPVAFAVFDKRVLLTLEQAAASVHNPEGPPVSVADLLEFARLNWFPILSNASLSEGTPLYVPTRVELLLELRSRGWGAKELEQLASYEELMIDQVYTTEDLAYIDDDLELLVECTRSRLTICEAATISPPRDLGPRWTGQKRPVVDGSKPASWVSRDP